MRAHDLSFRVADGLVVLLRTSEGQGPVAARTVVAALAEEGARQGLGPLGLSWHLPSQHYAEAAVPDENARIPTALVAGRGSTLSGTLTPREDPTNVPSDLWSAMDGSSLTATLDIPASVSASGPAPGWHAQAAPPADAARVGLWYATHDGELELRIDARHRLESTVGRILQPPEDADILHLSDLLLTPLGASAKAEADGAEGDSYSARMNLGRDVTARRVTHGHLSTGHRAVVIETAQRTIRRRQVEDATGVRWATVASFDLTTRLFVLESTVDLTVELAPDSEARRLMPFVTLTTAVADYAVIAAGDPDHEPCWLNVAGGRPFELDLVAVDVGGGSVTITVPIAFVPRAVSAAAAAQHLKTDPRPTRMPDQPVTLAPVGSQPAGSTTFEVHDVTLGAQAGATRPVIPSIEGLRVAVDAASQLAGRPVVAAVGFHGAYRSAGLAAANPQGALLTLSAPYAMALPSDLAGGIASPAATIDVLTTKAGAVAKEVAETLTPSIDDIKKGLLGPADGTGRPLVPRLFGSIDLLELLGANAFRKAPGEAIDVPGFTHTFRDGADVTEYHLETQLEPKDDAPDAPGYFPSAVTAVKLTKKDSGLTLDASITRPRDGGRVSSRSRGVVKNIAIDALGVAQLSFQEVSFLSVDGGAPAIDVKGVDVTFSGALAFVADLVKDLSKLGGDNGVSVAADSGGVTVRMSAALPDVKLAMLQFSDLRAEAALRIPFDGSPLRIRVGIADRRRPFLVTVSMFGGGGWFAVEFSADGLESIEIGIEFGGSLALDIVVASGAVTVMAGLYFSRKGDSETVIEAYLRASGHVSVLGIVTVYVEFVLLLGFRKERDRTFFYGRASVTVGVEVLMFSQSVTIPFSYEIEGAAADPGFLECFDEDDWRAYLAAFAPERAV